MLPEHARTLWYQNDMLGFRLLFVDRFQILQRSCDHERETLGTRWNILLRCCRANKHGMPTVTQNCWGAPLTCKACFGAAALRCSTLRTSPTLDDRCHKSRSMAWVRKWKSVSQYVPMLLATEVIFAMELDGQFAHVAPKITEPKGRWMKMVTAMFLQLQRTSCVHSFVPFVP